MWIKRLWIETHPSYLALAVSPFPQTYIRTFVSFGYLSLHVREACQKYLAVAVCDATKRHVSVRRGCSIFISDCVISIPINVSVISSPTINHFALMNGTTTDYNIAPVKSNSIDMIAFSSWKLFYIMFTELNCFYTIVQTCKIKLTLKFSMLYAYFIVIYTKHKLWNFCSHKICFDADLCGVWIFSFARGGRPSSSLP